MEVITKLKNINISHSAVAIGKFNGIHKGHVRLIESICRHENSVVFMFEKDKEAKKVLDEEEEYEIFASYGVKYLIKCPVDERMMKMSPEEFVKDILVDKLGVKRLYCGSDFRFGRGRTGDCGVLKEISLKYNFSLDVIEDCYYGDTKISSSLICQYIEEGRMEDADAMLGRPYTVTGEIVAGKKIGRKLNFPTINVIPTERKLLPPFGVYYTKVEIDGIIYDGVTNIGDNPTVNDKNNITVETNLLGQNEDFYGKNAKVMFYKFVRNQRKFASVEKLREQIQKDVAGYYTN